MEFEPINELYFNGLEDGYEGFNPAHPDNAEYMRGHDAGLNMVYSENPRFYEVEAY